MRRLALAIAIAATLVLSGYVGSYAAARAPHRLVRYDGFIAGPDVLAGVGRTRYQIVFAPLIRLEQSARRAL